MRLRQLAELLWQGYHHGSTQKLEDNRLKVSFAAFLGSWTECQDEVQLRELVDWEICLDLPMAIVCQTYEKLLQLTQRQHEYLDAYADFLSLFGLDWSDVTGLLRAESRAYQENDADKAAEIKKNSSCILVG